DAHDDRLRPSAVVSGQQPEHDPGGDRRRQHDQAQQQREAIAEHDAREDVAADGIRPEQVGSPGGQAGILEVGERARMPRERRDPRRERRQEHHDHDDAKTEQRSSVAGERIPGPPQVLPGGGCGHDAHAASSAWRSRMRGSKYPTRMSMRKLMTTKNSPMIMTTATIALRSLRRMTWTPYRAMPGQLKTASTRNALPSSAAKSSPRMVTVGINDGLSMYFSAMRALEIPNARAASMNGRP